MKKLPSLTIFFPFYNDAGTVMQAIDAAYTYGRKVTDDLEVIALHGGNSKDDTATMILAAKKKHRGLRMIDKTDNTEGYAVIKYGLQHAKKAWVFYTDGDLQYDLKDLKTLVLQQEQTGADIVNGYKRKRQDIFVRRFLGTGYQCLSRWFFSLPIRDTDCDFRLIRKSLLRKITLEARDASILPELIKKLQFQGAIFAEVPVIHNERVYGKSNYTIFGLLKEKIIGDVKLWVSLRTKSSRLQ